MCGICGQYNFGNDQPVVPETIRLMARALIHRGPDDEGCFISGPIGLGFRRLSIIDLAGGHQPMSDADGAVWVTFNGEIYNFLELRSELEAYGHHFRTKSDTEVIVHGYKQWGTKVLGRLNGMFGVAIWDVARKRLVLARDAAGIKLVYYHVSNGSVLFGSEIRAVLAALPEQPAVDTAALSMFLRYRYTPSPMTMHRGVRKLAPGTMAIFEDGKSRVERWYGFLPQPFVPPKSDADFEQELFEIYQRAVRRHLISDVPVGLLLSGGVDSGLLLGLMHQHGDSWPTYTVGYGKTAYKDDELQDAVETARIYSARNAAVRVSQGRFERALPKIVSVLEEPIASSSIVPMYFVCERARQDVKVALVGQGPDELFGGYTRHLGVHYGAYWRGLPKPLRALLGSLTGLLPRNEALRRGIESLGINDPMRRYQAVFSLMRGAEVNALFLSDQLAAGAGDAVPGTWYELAPEMHACDELGRFQVLEIRSSLPDELLMYADKLSMAHGLEVRVPYLDREVVEFVERLPAKFKVRFGQRKWLHKRVCQRFLPAGILRRKKRGFGVNVVDKWFRGPLTNNLSSYLRDESSLMYGFLRSRAVRTLLDDHQAGRRDNHKMLFSLVMFEAWLRNDESAWRNRSRSIEPLPVSIGESI